MIDLATFLEARAALKEAAGFRSEFCMVSVETLARLIGDDPDEYRSAAHRTVKKRLHPAAEDGSENDTAIPQAPRSV